MTRAREQLVMQPSRAPRDGCVVSETVRCFPSISLDKASSTTRFGTNPIHTQKKTKKRKKRKRKTKTSIAKAKKGQLQMYTSTSCLTRSPLVCWVGPRPLLPAASSFPAARTPPRHCPPSAQVPFLKVLGPQLVTTPVLACKICCCYYFSGGQTLDF